MLDYVANMAGVLLSAWNSGWYFGPSQTFIQYLETVLTAATIRSNK